MKIKRFLTILLLSGVFLFIGVFIGKYTVLTNATEVEKTDLREESPQHGLFTALSLSMMGEDGEIVATAKNKLTILPSNVQVALELYYSEACPTSFAGMTFIDKNFVADLNMGESLTVSAPTNGEQYWWAARIYYKIDSKSWQEKVTNIYLFDKEGKALNV